jgi:hypothetical protein
MYHARISLKGKRKGTNAPVKTVHGPSEIRTGHLANKIQKGCIQAHRYTSLLIQDLGKDE